MLGNLVSIGSIATDFISEALIKIGLFFDSLIYRLVSYSYNLFLLVCKLNFGFLYDIVSPLVDRVRALVMVFIVFKLALMIIKFMMNPDEAPVASRKTLLNILKVAALLMSYNLIFNFMDDVGMILLGAPAGYQYKTLSNFINVDSGKDDGIISRLIFGSKSNIEDVGDFIAFNTICVFLPDADDPNAKGTTGTGNGKSRCSELESVIAADGKNLDFGKLPKISTKVGKTVDYWYIVSGIVGIYLVICIVQASVKVGVRMFKLMALQMIAPIAIISMIDDKTSKMGKFISTYTSVYLEAFLRVGSMLITTVFISKFITNIKNFFSDKSASGMTEGLLIIIVVVAAFKFVNDLPKFLEESLGIKIKGDGVGFGGFLKSLAGGAVGLATGTAASAISGNGFGRSMLDGAKGMINGANAGNKSQGIADFFKKQIANTENIAKGARGNWIPGYEDEDGNWVAGRYARPSLFESIRDKSGFGQAYRNRVERDQHEEIDDAERERTQANHIADDTIRQEEHDRDAAQTQVTEAQREQRRQVEEQQRISDEHADDRERERVTLQREMSEAQSGMQEAQVNLKQNMERDVDAQRTEIAAQNRTISDQRDIESRILDSMKNDDSSFHLRNADGSEGAAIKFGTSAAEFAARAVANDQNVINANARITNLEGELATGHTVQKLSADEIAARSTELSNATSLRTEAATRIDTLEKEIAGGRLSGEALVKAREELSATITHRNDLDSRISTLTNEIGTGEVKVKLSDSELRVKRDELRQAVADRDQLKADITTRATQEFIVRQDSDANAGGTTVAQRQQIIASAQNTIEQREQNIIRIQERYDYDKANLDASQQATTTYYQNRSSEMAEAHRQQTIQDRADVQAVRQSTQAAIDTAQDELNTHNENITQANRDKQDIQREYDRRKGAADRLASQRLDGRRRRRPRIPRGGGGTP